jgi:D-glycero-D-manno-heptose 1,7-bisphosphate phosphatase
VRKAVFFDRDGVLNDAVLKNNQPYPPADAESLIVAEGALECLTRLRKAGYVSICVTNQPDCARGTRTWENIEAMNEKVLQVLPLDDLLVCLHDSPDNCGCRKPKPGMLLAAAEKWDLDLACSWMVGDRRSDVAAGLAAGCRTIFLDRGYDRPKETMPDFVCRSVERVADIILRETEGEKPCWTN